MAAFTSFKDINYLRELHTSSHFFGLGSKQSAINFYIANRPPVDDYPIMNELRGLAMGGACAYRATHQQPLA